MCFTQETERETAAPPRLFCFDFEGRRFSTPDDAVTPREIRRIVGGIPDNVPIVQILEDGTQKTLAETESVPLVHCIRFRRLPRFIRG